MKVDLKANPFYLDEEDIKWVEETLASLTLEEKIGQLFCPVGFTTNENILKSMLNKNIGGIMYRPGLGINTQKSHRFLQENSKIPLLLAANLESGGVGLAVDGTDFGKPLQAAACENDEEQGYRLGYISCAEGAAVGCNWSFAPIVDIDMNFRNPITNQRTFGDDADRVLRMGSGYLRGAHENGLAVSIKHFPGDGVDERDQHLHVTVNSLSADEWMNTYGKVYGGLIKQGAHTVMVGHMAQPAWAKKLNPELSEEETYMPATLSKELMQGLLRGELGFNGMIVTDASPMLGFTCSMPRDLAVPTSIAIGCDMFLFNKDFNEDYTYMLNGYKKGILTDDRLDEALTRILGVKASLGLHKKQKEGTLVPGPEALTLLRNDKFVEWAKECADKSVTLVKDTQNLFPISPEKTKRVVLFTLENGSTNSMSEESPLKTKLSVMLTEAGFEICEPPKAALFSDNPTAVEAFKANYDLVIYALDYPAVSNNVVVRLNWKGGMMDTSCPWFTAEVPTLAISFANPYHLLDLPQMKTFINAYTNNEYTVHAVMDKLLGKSEFKGISPVDPFCGRIDTRF